MIDSSTALLLLILLVVIVLIILVIAFMIHMVHSGRRQDDVLTGITNRVSEMSRDADKREPSKPAIIEVVQPKNDSDQVHRAMTDAMTEFNRTMEAMRRDLYRFEERQEATIARMNQPAPAPAPAPAAKAEPKNEAPQAAPAPAAAHPGRRALFFFSFSAS